MPDFKADIMSRAGLNQVMMNESHKFIKEDGDGGFKIGYSTKIGQMKFNSLSDKMVSEKRYDQHGNRDDILYSSPKAEHIMKTVDALATTLANAGHRIWDEQLTQGLERDLNITEANMSNSTAEKVSLEAGESYAELKLNITQLLLGYDPRQQGGVGEFDNRSGLSRISVLDLEIAVSFVNDKINRNLDRALAPGSKLLASEQQEFAINQFLNIEI